MENSHSQDKVNDYNPNHIPPNERKWNIILSLVLIFIGAVAIMVDDLPIPGVGHRGYGRHTSKTVHFHGKTIWVFFCAFICASANMISVVVDHYDRRNNEINYRRFARDRSYGLGILMGGIST
jgi:hypothetical protein